jgi:hypothetical protein
VLRIKAGLEVVYDGQSQARVAVCARCFFEENPPNRKDGDLDVRAMLVKSFSAFTALNLASARCTADGRG